MLMQKFLHDFGAIPTADERYESQSLIKSSAKRVNIVSMVDYGMTSCQEFGAHVSQSTQPVTCLSQRVGLFNTSKPKVEYPQVPIFIQQEI